MFQAIVTRYIGPTNYRGSRVKATASAGSVTLNWDDALNSEENHTKAAKALAAKYGWAGEWHNGGLPDNRGNCYVCADLGGHPAFVSYDDRRSNNLALTADGAPPEPPASDNGEAAWHDHKG